MLIDGYNVIHAFGMDTQNLEDARLRLLDLLDDHAGFSDERITVVFDGYRTREPLRELQYGLLTVVFTGRGVTADTHIQRAVKAGETPVTVVTADALEQLSVFGAGAVRMTPAELKDLMRATREKHAALLHRSSLTARELKKRLYLDALADG